MIERRHETQSAVESDAQNKTKTTSRRKHISKRNYTSRKKRRKQEEAS